VNDVRGPKKNEGKKESFSKSTNGAEDKTEILGELEKVRGG